MIKTHKEISILFLSYYMKTVPLSYNSNGENHNLTPWKLFDKFLKLPENKNLVPLSFNDELEDLQKQVAILVKNNNDLKNKLEQLELTNS